MLEPLAAFGNFLPIRIRFGDGEIGRLPEILKDEDGNRVNFTYFDVWVTLENAPSVDETKPARVLAGL